MYISDLCLIKQNNLRQHAQNEADLENAEYLDGLFHSYALCNLFFGLEKKRWPKLIYPSFQKTFCFVSDFICVEFVKHWVLLCRTGAAEH